MIDAESLGKVAEAVTKLIGIAGVCWHYGRGWYKDWRRKNREGEVPPAAAADAARDEIEEQTGRFMRNAVFSQLELSQEIERLRGDLGRSRQETALVERDRDQWRTLAEEREADAREAHREVERARREEARLRGRLSRHEEGPR